MERFEDKWQRRQEHWARQQERFQRRWAWKQERWAQRQQNWGHRHSPAHAALIGGIIVIVGILLLLDNMGQIHFHDYVQYWPAILIALGFLRIIESHGSSGLIWGGIVASIGTLLLLENLDMFRVDWHRFWPVMIIAWGVLVLLRHGRQGGPWQGGTLGDWGGPGSGPPPIGGPGSVAGPASTGQPNAGQPNPGQPGPNAGPHTGTSRPSSSGFSFGGSGVSSSSTINMWHVFSGGERIIDSQDFRGGEISAIFGGCEVDLTRAAIAADQAIIDVTAVFGGVEIRVPTTWYVEAKGIGVFGGFGEQTIPPRLDPNVKPQRLLVTGVGVFGGVTITN